MKLVGATLPGGNALDLSPMLTQGYWEEVFAGEDPWDYGNSAYESWKFDQTLSLLPTGRTKTALELGCAEGHLTARLAAHVGQLVAVDISPTAIARARARCRELGNVRFQVLNLAHDPLPQRADLILCSEVLFYLPPEMLRPVAAKIAASLAPGGHLLLAHGNLISDDRTRTGFDWGHPFGAKTIGKVFGEIADLALLRELRTPLFTVQLFGRIAGRRRRNVAPELRELPLPRDLVLTPEVESTVIWDGAVTTRTEAQESETASEVPILMYHSVADDGPQELAPYRVSIGRFREQLRYLRRHGYHSVTLSEWAAAIAARRSLPGRPVILTFDDGYEDFIDNAWPVLKRAGFSASIFVVTDKVGHSADWDVGVSQPLRLMNWKQLQRLGEEGVEIGSHSASHADFSAISTSEVRSQGERARAALHDKLQLDVRAIAFPWGRGDEKARSALAESGYAIGLTTWGGRSTLADDPMNLPRIEVFGDDDLETFAGKVLPAVRGEPQRAVPGSDSVGFDPPPARAAGPRPAAFAAVAATRRKDAEAEVVGFDLVPAAPTPGSDMPIHPDYAKQLAARLDALVGEFVKLQSQLLGSLQSPLTLQKRLTMMFAQPITGKVSRLAVSGEEISPGVTLNFDETAQLTLTIEPKADHSLSPDTYLNTVGLTLTGASEWLELRVAVDWRDLSLAERFQLCVYARPSRSVSCGAALYLPRKSGDPVEVNCGAFELQPADRNAVISGDLRMPDFIELDTERQASFALSFDTDTDLRLVFDYLNIYFA